MSKSNKDNPERVKTTRNREHTTLVDELRERMLKINHYLQFPEAVYLVDLVGDDLIQLYGRTQVVRAADAVLYSANDVLPEVSEQLTRLFEHFNEQYFGGKLPPYRVTARLSISYYGRTIWPECCGIELLAGSEAWMVARLLAEMAHIATSSDYGQRWRDELCRLDAAGAPMTADADTRKLSADDFIASYRRQS